MLLVLRKNGVITYTVIGDKRYSHDLSQGGMEISCKYTFTGENKDIKKLQLLSANYPKLHVVRRSLRQNLLTMSHLKTANLKGLKLIRM